MQQHAGGVDHRPQASVGQPLGGGAYAGDDSGTLGDRHHGPHRVQLATHQVGTQRMRQTQIGQAVEQLVDRRDRRKRVALRLRGSADSAGAHRAGVATAHRAAEAITNAAERLNPPDPRRVKEPGAPPRVCGRSG